MRALHLLLELILVIVTALFVLEYKDRIIERLLQRQGIDATIEFIDIHCLKAKDVHYQKLPIAKEALTCIRYAPLLHGRIVLSELLVKELNINAIEKLAKSKNQSQKSSPFTLPLLIERLHISAIYRYKGLNQATLIAHNVTLQKAKITRLFLKTFAGTIKAKGAYDKSLALQGIIRPNPRYIKKELPSINPRSIEKATFRLKLDEQKLTYRLDTQAKEIVADLNATLASEGTYIFKTKTYTSQNHLIADFNASHLASDINVTYNKQLTYSALGSLHNGDYHIPIKPSFYKTIHFRLHGDLASLQSSLFNTHFKAKVKVQQWKKVELATQKIALKALFDLPKELQKSYLAIEATYDKKLLAHITSDLANAKLHYDQKSLEATINPKDFLDFHLSALAPLHIQSDLLAKKASIRSPLLQAHVDFDKTVEGNLTIADAKLWLHYKEKLSLRGSIPSLQHLTATISKIYPIQVPVEARLSLKASYDPAQSRYTFSIRSPRVEHPLKKLRFLEVSGHGDKKALTIDYYAIVLNEHAFFATKPSKIRFLDGGVALEPFWIEDSLKIVGKYQSGKGLFQIASPRYRYSSIEGSMDLRPQLVATIDGKKVRVEGSVLLLQGDLSFKPKRGKTVEDPDIVVVDAPKKESPPFFRNNVALNIKIDAQKPIRYHIPDLELFLEPDLLVWKEFGKELELLGYVTIPKGSYKPLGEEYYITKSSLYFSSKPTNPFLEIHIKTKKESYTIYITVSGTLANPILTFDSDPYLPQKDILALLLLGSKSSNLLFKAVGGNQLASALSSMFLKNMLANFGLKLDTLTFSASGGFGFEVGKRISDKITVLYKNDQVSTIIIRYQLSDHFESEAIFGPQKSGINIFYRKVK